MGSFKQDRVSERIRIILSELLLREVSDPRLQGITITEVTLDPEMMFASVWVNALGEEEREEEVMQGLRHARGFLRTEIARRVRLRKTPELVFRWDHSLERSDRIDRLLSSLDIPPADPVESVSAEAAEDADDEWADD
ncbi:30S ribosome-binding factor RbfA [Anaerolineae bacterium CFX9]|nr:30S ribosome-binding factor RbfA [Anaerolineae bacterium CFX9]